MDYYNNIFYPDYLMHYGVKGMKWGHRKRYYDASGNLNARGIKKYAQKGYAQDSYNSNKTRAGKVYDKVTNAHNYGGKMMYNMSSNKANKARAEKYVADQQAKKDARNTPEAKAARKEKAKKAAKVGAAVAGTALAAYGAYKLNEYVKTKNGEIAAKRGVEEADKLFKDAYHRAVHTPLADGVISERRSMRSGEGSAARNAARDASKDSFRTAAKNVINYRKEEGKGSLNRLGSVDWYSSLPDQYFDFTKVRRRDD